MRHNGCQCRCCPYANRFKADYTTVMLIGNVEECKINPTFFPWSFHVVRFCERRVKFKLASPLYSDHPYNVFGRGGENRTHLMSSLNIFFKSKSHKIPPLTYTPILRVYSTPVRLNNQPRLSEYLYYITQLDICQAFCDTFYK